MLSGGSSLYRGCHKGGELIIALARINWRRTHLSSLIAETTPFEEPSGFWAVHRNLEEPKNLSEFFGFFSSLLFPSGTAVFPRER
jgi:hypothetical protein